MGPDATPFRLREDARMMPGERVKLVAAWVLVGIPAAWGVAQVIAKSMALFR